MAATTGSDGVYLLAAENEPAWSTLKTTGTWHVFAPEAERSMCSRVGYTETNQENRMFSDWEHKVCSLCWWKLDRRTLPPDWWVKLPHTVEREK